MGTTHVWKFDPCCTPDQYLFWRNTQQQQAPRNNTSEVMTTTQLNSRWMILATCATLARLGPHYGYMVTLRILLFGSAASVVKYNRFGDVLTSVPRVPTATQASKEQPPRHEHKIQGVFIYTLASKTSPSDCAYKESKTSHEPCLQQALKTIRYNHP